MKERTERKARTTFLNEIQKPLLSENSIIIKVHSASLNPIDYRIRNGDAKFVLRYSIRLILGHDFSGVIEAVGSKITKFRVDDSVYGRTPMTGAFQEYVVVGENDIAKAPKNRSLIESEKLTISIQKIYPISEINTAMKEISSGRVKGKIIVDFTNKKINE